MNKKCFPLNYLNNVFNFDKIFAQRKTLGNFQILAVIVFLNAVFLMPSSLFFAKIQNVPLREFYPNSFELIDTIFSEESELDNQINSTSDTSYFIEGENPEEGVLVNLSGIGDYHDRVETGLIIDKETIVIREKGLPNLTIQNPEKVDLKKYFQGNVSGKLTKTWLDQNRLSLIIGVSIILAAIFMGMHVLMISGASLLLYLAGKSKSNSIGSYKESVNFILNCMAVPTFIASGVGIIYYDILIMFAIQSGGIVITMMISFYKTRFVDSFEKLELS